jgi:hypothetical protein
VSELTFTPLNFGTKSDRPFSVMSFVGYKHSVRDKVKERTPDSVAEVGEDEPAGDAAP